MGALHCGRLRLTLPPVHVSLAEVQVLHTHTPAFLFLVPHRAVHVSTMSKSHCGHFPVGKAFHSYKC